MIIEKVPNGVVTKGLGESKKFTIKTSAKAFKILSKSLYSNPVGAVVRELSTNAYDAQVVNGNKDIPFELTLPTSLNPEFKIRDFGTGLSTEQIDQVYRTFFESTKTESNDVVGCLGLGSKSPFTIADSFFVTSYYGGMKTMIMAYIDEDDEPALSEPLIYEPTDEPTGLEIQIAVKREDIRAFETETHRQLRHFTVKPKVLGFESFNWSIDKIEYTICETKLSNDFRNSFAVQGQIAYPLDANMFYGKFEEDEWKGRLIDPRELIKSKCAIDFPIGSVDIAPSREALSYDERTIKAIKARVIAVATEIEDYIIEFVNSAKNVIEAKQRWYNFRTKFGSYILQFDRTKFEFDVSDAEIYVDANYFEGVKKFYKGGSRRYSTAVKSTIDSTIRDNGKSYFINVCNGSTFIRIPSGKKTGSVAISRQLVNQNGKNVYAIYTDLSVERIQEILGSDTIEVKDFSEYSHLLLLTKKTTKSAPKQKHSVKLLSTWASYRKSNCWTKVDRELTDEDYYVEVNRDDVVVGIRTTEPEYLIKFLNYCRERGMFTGNVYGLTPAQAKTTKAKSIVEFTKEFAANNDNVEVPDHGMLEYTLDYDVPESSLFHEIMEYARTMKSQTVNHYKYHYVRNWVMNTCNISVKTDKVTHPEELFEKYSLLTEAGIYKNNTALVSKMVRMIDCYASAEEGK